mmetsp:Transcript_66084/g.147541  ORF Transcript_66084/g.147541 Transcript_66084/m.147541 type:complete len:304 (+) Transcript_66084:660-1571(+)
MANVRARLATSCPTKPRAADTSSSMTEIGWLGWNTGNRIPAIVMELCFASTMLLLRADGAGRWLAGGAVPSDTGNASNFFKSAARFLARKSARTSSNLSRVSIAKCDNASTLANTRTPSSQTCRIATPPYVNADWLAATNLRSRLAAATSSASSDRNAAITAKRECWCCRLRRAFSRTAKRDCIAVARSRFARSSDSTRRCNSRARSTQDSTRSKPWPYSHNVCERRGVGTSMFAAASALRADRSTQIPSSKRRSSVCLGRKVSSAGSVTKCTRSAKMTTRSNTMGPSKRILHLDSGSPVIDS